MYKASSTIKLGDTDAAGIVFFVNYIKLAHEAYEAFMEEIGYSLKQIISGTRNLLVIAHVDADYKRPLGLGDRYSIVIKVEKIGDTSFALAYEFLDAGGAVTTTVRTVHVALDRKSRKPLPLPRPLREKLQSHV